jgi:UDP-glucuronate 4-epimerase
MSRDFTYIDDIVDGIVSVVDKQLDNSKFLELNSDTPVVKTKEGCNIQHSTLSSVYNIGNNSPISLMEFIETIENSIGKKAEKNFLPMQDGDVVSTYADVSGLINDFGYKPDTKLADGIGEFVKWYKKFYKNKGDK